jgi:ATP-dependent Lon protease
LKSDFFGNALFELRNDLSHDQYCARRLELKSAKPYKRNDDAVKMIASGLLKILFPDGLLSDYEFKRFCINPAIELRQHIWNQLQILDGEYRQYEREIKINLLPE